MDDDAIPVLREALSDLYQHLDAAGRKREALEILERFLEIEPDHVVDRYNLANLQYQFGDVDEALRNWRKVLELDATHRLAHDNLVAVLQERREHEELLAELERWSQASPDDAENWAILAWTHLQAARRDENYDLGPALRAARKAVELSGGVEARSLHVLGLVLGKTGGIEEAISALEKAAAAARAQDPPDEGFARDMEAQRRRLERQRDP